MIELARALMRALAPKVGSRVALAVTNPALKGALEGLIESSGAELVAEGGAHGCIVQIDGIERHVPPASRTAIELVSTGGNVVAIALGGTRGVVDGLADYWSPRLRCDALDAELHKSMTMMWGLRRRPISGPDRKRLRAIGHGLEATVLIGRAGLSPELADATEQALRRHGLVKVKMTSGSDLDKRQALEDLAWATGAVLIQRVGKSAVLYRDDVPLDPPGKRNGRR